MTVFDSIEDIFEDIRESGEPAKALVTLITSIGIIYILIQVFIFILDLVKCSRLYVCSQLCCKTDFKQRYGEWAVVSGATDGIGLEMAKEFAKRGLSVIIIGRNEEKLANSKAMIEKEPNAGQVVTVKIDLSDSSLENFERIRSQIDPENRDIGILVNNAGTFPSKFQRFNKGDTDFVRQIVNLNILATLYLTRMIMPSMLGRGKGLIVNISSILGSFPTPYMSVYGPTKAFIDSFTRQLQVEYSSHPIDIINVKPGAIATKLFTATSSISTSSPFIPSSDYFARVCVNALSTRISEFTGTFLHEVTLTTTLVFQKLGLLPFLFRMNLRNNAKDYELSPVPKRRQVNEAVQTTTSQTESS